MPEPAARLLSFLNHVLEGLQATQLPLRAETIQSRVRKRYNLTQCARFLGIGIQHLSQVAQSPGFPEGELSGRERVFTVDDLIRMRAILAQNAKRPYDYLNWRKPGDPLRVISFASQKGGTAKSLTSAHFAQYLSLHYGMRVGVIDADPQATLTLYFAGAGSADLPDHSVPTLVDFCGLYPKDNEPYVDHDAATLNALWRPTAWPGVRIIPAHANVSEGEIHIARILQHRSGRRFYRFLYDALERWQSAWLPVTTPTDLLRPDGSFDDDRFQAALRETLDVIVIDYQPAMTLFALNNLVASTDLIVPQTMKGFDLATLNTFLANLYELVTEIVRHDQIDICNGLNAILPTNVQRANAQDIDQLANLMTRCGHAILPVQVFRSDAIANAATLYQSCYEYVVPANQRQSMRRFTDNANAANDAIVAGIWPNLARGYANQWITDNYQTEEAQHATA